MFYAIGGGLTSPSGGDGRLTGTPLPRPLQTVAARTGDATAEVLYAGGAPGFIEGVLQVNLRIPPSGPTGVVPLVLTMGSERSPASVTVAIK